MTDVRRVAVVGLGKVGELVAVLLGRAGFTVVGYDARTRSDLAFEAHALEVTDAEALRAALSGAHGEVDAVVACLPYDLNIVVAEAAHATGTHYFDLTEDVPTTARVMELATLPGDAGPAAFVPQCGLAPGLIGIVGSSLAARFSEIRSIELKVGALPQNPTGLLGYAFNWSAEGVVNEYLNDCEVIRSGVRRMVPAMSEPERVVLDGTELEADLTSGGLGTMCQTYEGKVRRLDYKTLRYPGHFAQMRFLFDELGLRDRRAEVGAMLVDAKPPVNDDLVYLHASVEGVMDGLPHRENHVRRWLPLEIDGRVWRAISWTTAASAVAAVELLAQGTLPATGFVRQEDISLADLYATTSGRLFVEEEEKVD